MLSKVGVLDQSKLVMEYKRKDAESESWTSVPGLQENGKDTYSAKVTGLTPKTDYQYRFVYRDANEAESEIIDFTTEEQIALYNGNFEDWYGHANGGFLILRHGLPALKNIIQPMEALIGTLVIPVRHKMREL